jgi:peptide/nickel transport system substrate-binding protein
MKINKVQALLSILILFGIFFIVYPREAVQATEARPTIPQADRTGAWVDTIEFRKVDTMDEAITQLEAGSLEFYTDSSQDPMLYQRIQSNPDLVAHMEFGGSKELTFNPVGPVFNKTGKLNPFSVPKIREAMNWLVNRNYIANTIAGGMAIPKYLTLNPGQPEYARYSDTVEALEMLYAYDYNRADSVISEEMQRLGAKKVSGIWRYKGEPVTLIFIIRTEDERKQIGDYIADQLESIGFTIDRQYLTMAEALPLWRVGDPHDGLWHLYTGGWTAGSIRRDQGGSFDDFYTPRGSPNSPLWQAYTPTPEFDEAARKLSEGDFASMAERNQLFIDALGWSMEDSVRIWLMHDKRFSARRANTTAAYDMVGGLIYSELWPYTLRFIDQEGGTMRMALSDLLYHPWNPLAGSYYTYDNVPQTATQQTGLVQDPNTGLYWPQRIEKAEVYVQSGLVVTKTLDWVTLDVSNTIEVPADAWVDWDAKNQVWITAGEKFTQTQSARVKSVVYYPADLYTSVTWHDGSPFSVADVIMALIMRFDIANPDSSIYDESQVDEFDTFVTQFKGYRILSTNPLVIEYYSDAYNMDAELIVNALWPAYGRGVGAWHNMAVGYLADAAGDLAFSEDKSNKNGIGWMDFVSEPSLTILKGYLDQAQEDNYIPYANTMKAYVPKGKATTRWENLQIWYAAHGHFWLGTGPFYLEEVDHSNKTLTLQRYAAFPDPADKWDGFAHDTTPAALDLNFTTGAPGSAFNVSGSNLPINRVVTIYLNNQPVGTSFTGETGTFTVTLLTDVDASEGYYLITVQVNPTLQGMFQLDDKEPARPKEGKHETVEMPDGVFGYTDFLYLPLIRQ